MNRPNLVIEEKYTEAFYYFLTKEKDNVIDASSSDGSHRELYFKKRDDSVRWEIRKKKLSNWFQLTVAYVLCKKNLRLYVFDILEVFENWTPQSSLKY